MSSRPHKERTPLNISNNLLNLKDKFRSKVITEEIQN